MHYSTFCGGFEYYLLPTARIGKQRNEWQLRLHIKCVYKHFHTRLDAQCCITLGGCQVDAYIDGLCKLPWEFGLK